jgi:hypothetical protein
MTDVLFSFKYTFKGLPPRCYMPTKLVEVPKPVEPIQTKRRPTREELQAINDLEKYGFGRARQ